MRIEVIVSNKIVFFYVETTNWLLVNKHYCCVQPDVSFGAIVLPKLGLGWNCIFHHHARLLAIVNLLPAEGLGMASVWPRHEDAIFACYCQLTVPQYCCSSSLHPFPDLHPFLRLYVMSEV